MKSYNAIASVLGVMVLALAGGPALANDYSYSNTNSGWENAASWTLTNDTLTGTTFPTSDLH